MELTDEQRQFLESHQMAVLGTGKRDGSPQLSMINYRFDGTHIFVSVTSDRAKWKNTQRLPKIAMVISEGHRQLVIYGSVEGIPGGPGRDAAIASIRAAMGNPLAPDADMAAFSKQLDEAKRVVLKITPEQIFANN
jgi:PPOX class probable F420-dependent enzyme